MNLITAVLLILAPVGVNGLDENEQAAKSIEQLGDDDPAVRERATEALIAMGPDILPLVEKALASDDPEVKSRAEKVAAVLRIKKEVRFSDNVLAWYPDIYRDLAEGTEDARSAFQVFRKLTERDELEDTPIHDVENSDVTAAMKILAGRGYLGMGSREKMDVIRRCRQQRHVLKQLSGPPSGVETPWGHQIRGGMAEHLALLLKDGDSRVREEAVESLADMHASAYAKEISSLLQDEDAAVRQRAILTLGKWKANEHSKGILALLKHEDSSIRACAAIALTELGHKDTVLKNAIEDVKKHMRSSNETALRAMSALRFLGVSDAEIKQALEKEEEPDVDIL